MSRESEQVVKLMNEYTVEMPLWPIDEVDGVLGLLPPALIERLRAWARGFDEQYDREHGWRPGADVLGHAREAHALRLALTAELGATVDVALDLWEAPPQLRVPADLRITPCAPVLLARLEESMPAGNAHRAHLAAQERGTTTYLVATVAGEPVAVAVVAWAGCHGPAARAAHPDAVEISHLQVRQDRRGGGIGTALVLDAEARIAMHGHRLVAVGVADDNPRAAALYRRLGYEPTPVTEVFEYDWEDASGTTHHAVERTTLLTRRVG